MSFPSTIYTTLHSDSTLTGLCPQIFPQQPVDNVAFPFCWYSFTRHDNLVFGGVATAISNYTFDINCFAATQAAVNTIAARIITLLDGFKSAPNVGSCVLSTQAQNQRSDGYIYFVNSLRFTGMGV